MDKNHSHFILVKNDGQEGTDDDFRTRFEEAMSRKHSSDNSKLSLG